MWVNVDKLESEKEREGGGEGGGRENRSTKIRRGAENGREKKLQKKKKKKLRWEGRRKPKISLLVWAFFRHHKLLELGSRI